MFVSESWLRSFVNPPIDTERLCEKLTMAGLEVEEKKTVAPAFSGVVVAEIVAIEPHPDADRLRVCQVNAGTAETIDRKSTRLNSSHVAISYAVFCLKKKTKYRTD